MTRYFLGIDTGATKSHAVIADETGQAVGFAQGGPGNQESIGYDGLAATLRAVTGGALKSAGIAASQLAAAGFGLAGYDWPMDDAPTRAVIDALGLNAPYTLANDSIVGLVAGASAGWGVVIIAGTGCNARGRDANGREGRVTGEGGHMGEFGGGGELVYRASQALGMAWTRRGPPTRLTNVFIDYFGASSEVDLLEGICRRRYSMRAALAPLVFSTAQEGDEVALECVRWAGRELGSLANGVIRQLGFEALDFEVVLAGSLFKGGSMLIDPLRETIHRIAPGARLTRLDAPPVVGGVLLAMEQAGRRSQAVRARLIETVPLLMTEAG